MDNTRPLRADHEDAAATELTSPSAAGVDGSSNNSSPLALRTLAFVTASLGLFLIFVASGIPIALFSIYVAHGFTTSDITVATIAYFLGVAVSLLFLARVSDHLGRRPMMALAAVCSIVGCVLLANVHSLLPLIAGRALQGAACGLASTAIGAYVLESAPPAAARLKNLIVGTVPPLGVPVGAIISGGLVRWAPHPTFLGLVTAASAIGLFLVAIILSPETSSRRRSLGRGLRSMRPQLLLPPTGSRTFFVSFVFIVSGTWAMGGFFQAFGPAVASEVLDHPDPLFAAVLFASYVIPVPLGGAISARLAPRLALPLGSLLFFAAVAGMAGAFIAPSTPAFFVSSVIAGLGNGVAMSGGVRGLLGATNPIDKARMLATIYLVSYLGAAAPGIVASLIGSRATLDDVTAGYLALAAATSAAAMWLSRASWKPRGPHDDGPARELPHRQPPASRAWR